MPHKGQDNVAENSVSLVGMQVSSSAYDEVFLNCTDGYCVFDENQHLQAFSSDFPKLYPNIIDTIHIGMSYEEYIRVFVENEAIRNLGQVDSIEQWVQHALTLLEKKTTRHTHHLTDGRWMQINVSRTSTGHWLFIANDITELRLSQLALEESNERFRSFAHLAMDWFWELDADLRYVYHSNHTPSLTGIDDEDLVGMSRLESIGQLVIDNDALAEHNYALLNLQPLDVVLEWKSGVSSNLHVHVIAHPVFDSAGKFTGYMGSGREVTDEVVLKSTLNHLAEHDDLTGLVNRRAFERALTDSHRSSIQKSTVATLCFIDLDQFKLVNDGGGHEAGDQLLIDVAKTFCEILGDQALVARLGGDEFGVVFSLDINDSLAAVNDLIRHISSTPFTWNQRNYTIGASAGLVRIDSGSRDISELMSHADTACYMAKNAGRNQAQVYMYDEFFQDPVSLELKQVNLLKEAMDNNGLMIFLQPIKPIQKERSHTHFEVLLRLLQSDGTLKSAGEFISVAEKYDLVQHLDRWVLEEGLRVLVKMESSGLDVSLSINISGNTLNNKDSFQLFTQMITASRISPSLLTFEVTETAAIKNILTAKKFIRNMKRFGCGFSLDDFGSGFSSFGYLKELPVDYLKIDGSFVKDMNKDPTCRAIVSAFNQLSHELGMETVAEFVEDEETEILLRELGVDFVQGFGVAEPRHSDEWVEFLSERPLRANQ